MKTIVIKCKPELLTTIHDNDLDWCYSTDNDYEIDVNIPYTNHVEKVNNELDNDQEGSWGLVINKPLTTVSLGSLIHKSKKMTNQQKELFNVKIPIYWGGPINQNKILILHSEDYKNETTKKFKKLSISSDYKILFEIAGKKGPKESLVIVGLSAWTLGQLDGEVEKGDWTFSEIKNDLIFNKENKIKWQTAIKNQFIPL